jgi:DNA-binding transcriptional ArsR family regulator
VSQPDDVVEVHSVAQYAALGHPLRLRLLAFLGQKQATISQLAVELDTRKGNVAHHLAVLREAGLVRVAHTRTVRGGTEQYYERVARKVHFTGELPEERKALTLRVLADEVGNAEPDPFLMLRYVHLTQQQAERLKAVLTELVDGVTEASADEPRYRMLVGLFRPAS